MQKSVIGLVIAILCFAFAFGGCCTASRMVSPTADIQKGERLEMSLRMLKIVQVCDDCVLVKYDDYSGLKIAVVPLVNDYVTDSYLRAGIYEYVGPYTYTTVKDENGNNGTHTVRLFKEVVPSQK